MTLTPHGANRGESVKDYEKFAKIQEDFLERVLWLLFVWNGDL